MIYIHLVGRKSRIDPFTSTSGAATASVRRKKLSTVRDRQHSIGGTQQGKCKRSRARHGLVFMTRTPYSDARR